MASDSKFGDVAGWCQHHDPDWLLERLPADDVGPGAAFTYAGEILFSDAIAGEIDRKTTVWDDTGIAEIPGYFDVDALVSPEVEEEEVDEELEDVEEAGGS